jgi:hypothetical protein
MGKIVNSLEGLVYIALSSPKYIVSKVALQPQEGYMHLLVSGR